MIALLLAVTVWAAQGIPVQPNQSGTVTGTLKTAAGTPAAGVRVSALASPESTTELALSNSLAGLAETDASGRFRLENIPPGRYYIVAGRIDLPTFYPGAITANEGKVILVTPGITIPGIDFALNNVSAGRAISAGSVSSRPSWVIAMQTRIEGGGRVPVFSDGWFPLIRLARNDTTARIEASLSSASIMVTETEYRATVENLPETYILKSFNFGPTDLRANSLKLDSATTTTTGTNLASAVPVNQSISIVLEYRARPQPTGVRISGRIGGNTNRSIYLSGTPGTLYPDGTFEFRGVQPGRYAIVTLDNPDRERPLGASIVVGNRDMPNVELVVTPIAPFSGGLQEGLQSPPPANLAPNSQVPLASIRGRIVDSVTGVPFDAGRIVVNNDYSFPFSLEADGRFEVPRLLPGTYNLEIAAFGIGILTKSVVLDDRDAEIELTMTYDR